MRRTCVCVCVCVCGESTRVLSLDEDVVREERKFEEDDVRTKDRRLFRGKMEREDRSPLSVSLFLS